MCYSSYLVRLPSSYYFRYHIPPVLQSIVGRKEIRYSLRCGSLSEAKPKARLLAGRIHQLLSNKSAIMEITQEQIQELVKSYVNDVLSCCEEFRANKSKPYALRDIETLVEVHQDLIGESCEDLALCNYSNVEQYVDKVLLKAGLNISKESFSYKVLSRELLKAHIQTLEIEKKRTLGDYSLTYEEKELAEHRTVHTQPEKVSSKAVLFSELIQNYWNEKITTKAWKPRTQTEYESNIKLFIEFFGADTPVDTIDAVRVREFKETLMKLPKNYRKYKRYKGMSVVDVAMMKIPEEDRISIATINDKYLSLLDAVFNHAESNGFIKNTPIKKGLKIKESKKRKASEERDMFDQQDLKKMFTWPEYREQDQPYKFWLPLLALYSGCRIEELCQLYCEDLKEEDGICILDINEEHADQSIKTSKRRIVPLHPQIISLGFIKFVQAQKDEGHERIFSELKRQSNKYSHYPSRWFNQFKKKCDIDTESGKKVFHSFRHTFYSNLAHQSVESAIIDSITGHAATGSEGQRRYTKAYPVKVLYEEAILKLNFGVDLAHLKKD